MQQPICFLTRICLVFILLAFCVNTNAQKITDTIFFNNRWEICEKPIAAYYRIGTLSIDSFWFYTGKVKDYNMEGRLVMEGEYTEDGYKNGLFQFYFLDGSVMISGRYNYDRMIGNWQWNYPNKTIKALIHFDSTKNDFRFIEYNSPKGKNMLSKGTGDFEWQLGFRNSILPGYKVEGSFENGKRKGSWRYYIVNAYKNEMLSLTEKYDRDGNFKKAIPGTGFYAAPPEKSYEDYNFNPPKIWITENIKYDQFFRKGGEENSDLALKRYLLNRRSSEIIVKDKKFEEAMLFIIRSLESNRGKLEYQTKEINGRIRFKLGDKGYPEDITIKGDGITEKEKEFIIFLMSKFRNIEMPGTETIAFEEYHTIYVYSINVKEFMPASMRDEVNNDLFFSTMPRESFLVLMRSVKKKIKKYIREEFQFYW